MTYIYIYLFKKVELNHNDICKYLRKEEISQI